MSHAGLCSCPVGRISSKCPVHQSIPRARPPRYRSAIKPPPPRRLTRVTLVAGPPCSGKTAYVAQRATSADLILDLDRLQHALGSPTPQGPHPAGLLPFALAARDAVLGRLAAPSGVARAWVIAGAPTRAERAQIGAHETVVLAVSADECITRARRDNRGARTVDWIRQWWAAYEPDPAVD